VLDGSAHVPMSIAMRQPARLHKEFGLTGELSLRNIYDTKQECHCFPFEIRQLLTMFFSSPRTIIPIPKAAFRVCAANQIASLKVGQTKRSLQWLLDYLVLVVMACRKIPMAVLATIWCVHPRMFVPFCI
jgi:hypothetical protein